MSGLTVIRVRHRCCFLFAYLTRFCKGAGGPEIAKSREMAWGRRSIQFPKHSAMPGVVHESGDEPVEKTVEKTVEKSMMYYLCY